MTDDHTLEQQVKLRIHRDLNGGDTYHEVGPIRLAFLKTFVIPTLNLILDDLNKGVREIVGDQQGTAAEWKLQVRDYADPESWKDWSVAQHV